MDKLINSRRDENNHDVVRLALALAASDDAIYGACSGRGEANRSSPPALREQLCNQLLVLDGSHLTLQFSDALVQLASTFVHH